MASIDDLTVRQEGAGRFEVSSSLTRGRCATVHKFGFSDSLNVMPALIPSYMQGITDELIREAVGNFIAAQKPSPGTSNLSM